MVPLYCASDVLAVTSISESSSLVAIEAQTCGTRCVLSSGVPDESIVSSNAYKMDANASVDDWSKALLDSSLRRKTVVGLENYDMKNVKEHLKEVYLKYWNSSSSCIN